MVRHDVSTQAEDMTVCSEAENTAGVSNTGDSKCAVASVAHLVRMDMLVL
jgi:hypothetical protein